MRDAQLAAIAAAARSKNGPLVLAGDLNVTSWSAAFDLLTDRTRLVDSRAGFGVQPSWPKWFGPGRIPIDHCLVTPEIAVRDRFVGPDLGSDHFPIVVDFTIQKVRD
jgi:endonuclease/exonuclease/phosphatase (EEP) superfamily protein YafD